VGDGFKVADAFVDVSVDLDDAGLLHDVETASDKAGNILSDGMDKAGKDGGRRWGTSFSDRGHGLLSGAKAKFGSLLGGIGDDGGKRSGLGFAKGLAGGIISGATQGASKVGGILSKGLENIGPAGPVIGAALVGMVALAAPLAGAALAGGLMAGVAAGGVGLGIAAAIRQPAVKGALVALKNDAVDILDDIGKDWQPTMLSAIASVRGQMKGIGSELKSALAPAKSYVQPLVNGFMSLVRNALPGFNAMLARSGPIIAVLADGLGEIGYALSDAFESISGETDNAAAGLQTMLYFVADLISMGGQVVAWLAAAYRYTLDWTVSVLSFLSYLPGVGDQFAKWRDEMKLIQDTANGAGPALQGAGAGMEGYAGATSRASQSNEAMANRQRILNGTMAQGADAAGDLKSAMDALNGAAQSAEQAELAYQEALDNAKDSLKENGKTLDSHTVKGRANRTALLNLAQAGQRHAQAVYDQTAATKGTSAAESAAARAYANSREKLIQTRMAMGDSRAAAVAYANKIMAIPKSWSTKVKADTAAAMNAIRGVKTGLAGIPNVKTVTIAMKVTGHQNASAVAASLRKQGMATGGRVTGPGLKGVDSQLRLLAPGEHVLTDKEVDAAGGHSAIEAWRGALRSGVKVAGGGSSSTPSSAGSSLASMAQQAAQVFQFGPGSIVLDLSSFRSLQEIMDAVTGLGSASRTFRSSTVTRVGIA
jgi:hypothetical protein